MKLNLSPQIIITTTMEVILRTQRQKTLMKAQAWKWRQQRIQLVAAKEQKWRHQMKQLQLKWQFQLKAMLVQQQRFVLGFFFNCHVYTWFIIIWKRKNNLPFVFQEGDGNSIADMLRATAEEAMTQTGFVFDENTGMYYDHSTGFYYDSVCEPKLQSYCWLIY